MTAKDIILTRRLGGGAGGGGGGGGGSVDLSAVDVYIADYQSAAELVVTAGAVDRYARLVVS